LNSRETMQPDSNVPIVMRGSAIVFIALPL
jgi:hypothetical protein